VGSGGDQAVAELRGGGAQSGQTAGQRVAGLSDILARADVELDGRLQELGRGVLGLVECLEYGGAARRQLAAVGIDDLILDFDAERRIRRPVEGDTVDLAVFVRIPGVPAVGFGGNGAHLSKDTSRLIGR